MDFPTSIEGLLGFHPPPSIPLSEDMTGPVIENVKGKRFGRDDATFISRYGNTDYNDHPLQWLEFSNDGTLVRSYCPGPDDSDASVQGPFIIKEIDDDENYVIELTYGCKTTFLLKKSAVDEAGKTTNFFMPMLVTCQREGCPQRHLTRVLEDFSDFDELSGQRNVDDPGVVVLRRCKKCRQVHYCSIECQRKDWRARHRSECAQFGKRFYLLDVDIPNASASALVNALANIFLSCITCGEERQWSPEHTEMAKAIGRRLYKIGGIELCRMVCDDLREHFMSDSKRCCDARTLEILWCHPVIPDWHP